MKSYREDINHTLHVRAEKRNQKYETAKKNAKHIDAEKHLYTISHQKGLKEIKTRTNNNSVDKISPRDKFLSKFKTNRDMLLQDNEF